MRPDPLQSDPVQSNPHRRQRDASPELIQRRRQITGLLLIALIILLASIWRAGLAAMFPPGWWRLW